MPAIGMLGRRTLLGLEAFGAPGVAVTPNKALTSMSLGLGYKITTDQFVQEGSKVASQSSLTEDSGVAPVSGDSNFNELQVLFAGLIRGVNAGNTALITPTAVAGTAGAYQWDFDITLGDADPRATFTIERSSKTYGQRAAYGAFVDGGFEAARPGKCTLNGNMITGQVRGTGDQLTPTFTPVATDPAAIGANVPLLTNCFNVFASLVSRDDLTANAATTKLTQDSGIVPKISYKIGERANPIYGFDCNLTSYAALGEGFKGDTGFTVSATPTILRFVDTVRKGALAWLRYQAFGPLIGAGPARYTLEIDTAVFLAAPSPAKDIGGKILGYDFSGVFARDDNFGGSAIPGTTHVRLINTAATILG